MKEEKYKPRKSIRLDDMAYMDGGVFHITMQCHEGKNLLVDDTAAMILDVLRNVCFNSPFRVFVATIMPNHVHVLCCTDRGDNLLRHINRFKAVCTTLFHRQGFKGPLWQKRYYDHGLRTHENVKQTALYILENPVRKGLADYWEQWPYVMVSESVLD